MIVIDENAEERLLKMLDLFKGKVGAPRCLHLYTPTQQCSLEKIIEVSNAEIFSNRIDEREVLAFLCEDGDMYILSMHLSPSQARTVMERTGTEGELHELVHGWMPVIVSVQRKVDLIASRLESNARRMLEQKQERMRHAIINRKLDPEVVSSLPERRMKHERPEVIVIEDDLLSRRLVFHALREHCNLTTLTDAQHAIDIYAERAPHMLLLDINLPDVTGHDLLPCIMAIDPAAYVVMLSGNGDKANVLRAVEAGASGFVGKPFSKERLLHYLERSPFFRASPSPKANNRTGERL